MERLDPEIADDHVNQNDTDQQALRLGMRLVRGLPRIEALAIAQAVHQHGSFDSIRSLWQVTGVKKASLKRFAQADAFGSLGIDRQMALWQIRALGDESLPMFDGEKGQGTKARRHEGEEERKLSVVRCPLSEGEEEIPVLPFIGQQERVVQDYRATGLSLRAHPMSFIRSELDELGVVMNVQLQNEINCPHGMPIAVAGLVLVRQRPGTASGIVFMTLEDETATANLIVRPNVFERYHQAARHSVAILAQGRVERQGEVVHVMVHRIQDITDKLQPIPMASRDFH